MNGIQYSAEIRVNAPRISIAEAQSRFRSTGAEWSADDGQRGSSGVFRIDVQTDRDPVFVEVSSPCYYFGDVDGVPVEDTKARAGFVYRFWYEE